MQGLVFVMVKPIPIQLLIHSVQYEEFKGSGSFGDEWEASKTLTNVRVEAPTTLQRTETREDKVAQAILFYDCALSNPKSVQFKENDKITFNNKTMYVKTVDPIYGFTLHHYELVLV